LTIFSTSLSVAAFLRRAGGSMLESTGSHGWCTIKMQKTWTISNVGPVIHVTGHAMWIKKAPVNLTDRLSY